MSDKSCDFNIKRMVEEDIYAHPPPTTHLSISLFHRRGKGNPSSSKENVLLLKMTSVGGETFNPPLVRGFIDANQKLLPPVVPIVLIIDAMLCKSGVGREGVRERRQEDTEKGEKLRGVWKRERRRGNKGRGRSREKDKRSEIEKKRKTRTEEERERRRGEERKKRKWRDSWKARKI